MCERLQKFKASQKRDLGACKGTSLLGSGVESLIFYTKNKKINKYNYTFQILWMSLIE